MSGYVDSDILGYETQALSDGGPVCPFEEISRPFRGTFNVKAQGVVASVKAGLQNSVARLRSFFARASNRASDINGDYLAANAEAVPVPEGASSVSARCDQQLSEEFDPYKIWGQPD